MSIISATIVARPLSFQFGDPAPVCPAGSAAAAVATASGATEYARNGGESFSFGDGDTVPPYSSGATGYARNGG